MVLRALLFFILTGLIQVHALSLSQFSSHEIKEMTPEKREALYESYMAFLKEIEDSSLYPLQAQSSRTERLRKEILNFFVATSYAEDSGKGQLEGEVCFFGGYESHIKNGYCVHPRFIEQAEYEACDNGGFRCRPDLFQSNTCIEITTYDHLTDKCYAQGKLEPEQLREKLTRQFFQDFQSKVQDFCDRNPPYDACDTLQSLIEDFLSQERLTEQEESEEEGAQEREVSESLVEPVEEEPKEEEEEVTNTQEKEEAPEEEEQIIQVEDTPSAPKEEAPVEEVVESVPEETEAAPREESEREVEEPVERVEEVEVVETSPEPEVEEPEAPQEEIDLDNLPSALEIAKKRRIHVDNRRPSQSESEDEDRVKAQEESEDQSMATQELESTDETYGTNEREQNQNEEHRPNEQKPQIDGETAASPEGNASDQLEQNGLLSGRVFNCQSNLMVRSAPTESSEWKGRLNCPKGDEKKGEQVEILDIEDNGWIKIRHDGQEGYVSGKYVQLNHAVDVAYDAFKEMERLDLSGDYQDSSCATGGVPHEHCEHDEHGKDQNSRTPTQIDNDFMRQCTGRGDSPDTRKSGSASVENPTDYILSRSYETRDINGSRADGTCRGTNWDSLEKQLGIQDGGKISIQDYVDYRCRQMKPGASCERANFEEMKKSYEDSLEELDPHVRRQVPSAEETFDYLDNAEFVDHEGNKVQIPKSLAMSMMYKESRGRLNANRQGADHGLFQISSDYGKVKKDIEGHVIGNRQDEKYTTSSSNPHEKSSIYHPYSNIDKFVDIMRAKWNRMRGVLNGHSGTPEFSNLSQDEQWQYVLASYNGGEANIYKPLTRILKFNKAIKCNSCDQFRPVGGQCQNLKLSCDESHAQSCGEPLPVKFQTIERFNNFSGHSGDPDYERTMKCFREQHMTSDRKGPCNVGVTFTYTRGMESLQSCFESGE